VGEVVAVHIIPRPHDELSGLYPDRSKVKKGAGK